MENLSQQSIERQFVMRLAQGIRIYNAMHSSTAVPLSKFGIAAFETDIKKYGDERKRIETEIAERYNIAPNVLLKIVKEIYAEMNADDGGFVMGKGSPMWQRIDEYVAKFTAAIKAIREAN